ncbi:phosphoadenosine phosphosulfate reductase family protein [Ruegeria sp. HKCCA4812]|uniref:phosphoadenosine phosphosulfate reductase family protein n=1 Tax=Ruegeria sp. HKCCA4812 TaxID=2682993 RepID=UPI001489F075|nr:phosphoadenosine phosphosulfate reductase family protein [Ruegeria sp. HKCCA4812]
MGNEQLKPYTLPQGNVQICFSGGRTSAYMLHQVLEANGGLPDRAKVIFANTGREMPETLDFVQEVSDRWSVPIVWVEDAKRGSGQLFDVVSHNSASRNGEPFARLIERKKACPDQSKRFCTENLKLLPARRFLMTQGWTNWTNALGIRADETQRVKPSPDKRVVRWFPLADAGVSKRDVLAWWGRQDFDLCVPDGLGNCDGCFLKSEATLAALARDHPDRHQWWVDMENKASALTANPNGARFRDQYTRAELGRFVERQGDWIFETEGALCQAGHGECTG